MTASTALGPTLVSRCSIELRPCTGAALLGLALSAASLAATGAVVAGLKLALPASMLGVSAAAGVGNYPLPAFVLLAVLLAPLAEMLMFQCLPIEVLRRLGAGFKASVMVSALLFAFAHYWNGGLAHGTSTLVSGLVFAYGYALCRPYGWLPACLAAFTAHAAQNAALVSLGLVFPDWALS